MDTSYIELYFIFGMMALIIIFGTGGLILFVRYLNRDGRDKKHMDQSK